MQTTHFYNNMLNSVIYYFYPIFLATCTFGVDTVCIYYAVLSIANNYVYHYYLVVIRKHFMHYTVSGCMVCSGAADNMVLFENKKAAFEFNCSGEGDGVSRVAVNGSYNYNSPETGVSCTPVNPKTGFNYFHVSILLLASNNNTNISCEVVNATNAIVKQKIFRIQIQGNIFITVFVATIHDPASRL